MAADREGGEEKRAAVAATSPLETPPPADATPPPADAAPTLPPAAATQPMIDPRVRADAALLSSAEAAPVIVAAFGVVAYSDAAADGDYVYELEMAQVSYKHTLRKLKAAHPESELYKFVESSPEALVSFVIRLAAVGERIPAVERAACMVGIDLEEEAREEAARMRSK